MCRSAGLSDCSVFTRRRATRRVPWMDLRCNPRPWFLLPNWKLRSVFAGQPCLRVLSGPPLISGRSAVNLIVNRTETLWTPEMAACAVEPHRDGPLDLHTAGSEHFVELSAELRVVVSHRVFRSKTPVLSDDQEVACLQADPCAIRLHGTRRNPDLAGTEMQ